MHVRTSSVFALALGLSYFGSTAAPDEGFRLVLTTDQETTLVRILSENLDHDRYALFGMRVASSAAGKRQRVRSESVFAVDCHGTRRLATISMRLNSASSDAEEDTWVNVRAKGVPEKFSISDLAYSPIAEWLEGKRTAAGTAVQALKLFTKNSFHVGCEI